MPDSVTLKLDTAAVQVKPGASATVRLTVRNRTEEVGNYTITIEGVPAGWVSASPEQVSAFPMQDIQADISVNPPADATGAVYHVQVRAATQSGSGGVTQLDVDVPATFVPPAPPQRSVPPPPPTTAPESSARRAPTASPPKSMPESRPRQPFTPPPAAPPATSSADSSAQRTQTAAQIEVVAEPIKGAPPPAVQWKLALHNAGTVLDTFAFSIAGIKPAWVKLQPAQVTLNPDETGNATLTVTPPQDTAAGSYPFVLRTFSYLNLNQRTDLPLKVDVTTSAGFQMAIDPKDIEAQGQRDFRVVLSSTPTSNTDLWLNLSAADPDGACDYVFEQAQVFVPAKQAVAGILRVRPRAVLNPGERKMIAFRVTATERDGRVPPQVADARLTQVGASPLRVVLRPQVNSAELDASYTVLAVNPSGVETTLVFSGEDPELGCEYTFQPPRVVLPPGAEAQVTLRARARANFEGEGSKEYAFTVNATRAGELVPVATATGKFVQQTLKPVKLALIPAQISSTGSAQFVVKASNPRPKAVQVLLAATDEADALSFSFSPSEINLAPGSEGSATITAKPKDSLMKGEQRRVHKFAVTGTVEGAAVPPVVNGTLAQIPGVDLSGFTGGGFKLFLWFARWLLFFIFISFLATLVLAGIEVIEKPPVRNERLVALLTSVINPAFVRTLIEISPFGGLSRAIADFMRYLVDQVLFPH
ncbi:MAG: hypothetical protein HZB53_02540 [Chloroflexi bacterium]|nr:hypothetical protein [Chloroflexota bacterium]